MNQPKTPNILFIMSDDHAAHAISAYGSRINQTPQIDRIARGGMRLNHCYCTNAICTPSRAAILTGQHAHINGVRTLGDRLDGRRPILVQKLLKAAHYQTAIVGKWHLGHGEEADPSGFDYWNILPRQGLYHDPIMYEMGEEKTYPGYVSEIITDLTIEWLNQREAQRPFFLMCHHKAPHRPWHPGEKYKDLYADEDIPLPETFWDDYSTRGEAARAAKMRMEDLTEIDLKGIPPKRLSLGEERIWRYQRYIKDYLRCCASIDDSVGRLLDYLDQQGLAENTVVIYTSDQGFFLGDHGWFDKRFMYEHSLRMPFLVRYPEEIPAGSVCEQILTNIDFAPTFLAYAGLPVPPAMQGIPARAILRGEAPAHWQKSLYYRYWMHKDIDHNVYSHYGVRTQDYKLIYYYGKALGCTGTADQETQPEWELFDLNQDPLELKNVYSDPAYARVVAESTAELDRLQREAGDTPEHRSPS